MRLFVLWGIIFLMGCSNPQAEHLKEQQQAQTAQELRFREQSASKIKEAMAPFHPKVRTFALRMAELFPGDYNFGQVSAIWYYLKDRWGYVNDPRDLDYFAPAYESIESNLSGDCDDFAILMASAIEAIGGSSRIILAYGKKGSHAYCEVYASNDPGHIQRLVDNLVEIDAYRRTLGAFSDNLKSGKYKIYFHQDARGYWLNLDYSAIYPGGPLFPAYFEMAVYPDGRYEVIKGR